MYVWGKEEAVLEPRLNGSTDAIKSLSYLRVSGEPCSLPRLKCLEFRKSTLTTLLFRANISFENAIAILHRDPGRYAYKYQVWNLMACFNCPFLELN